MEIVLKLYTYVDGVNDTPFPNAEEQAMFTFTYDANRMGGSPQISATVKHRLCLDNLWNDKVYAEFRGEKYFIMNTPSSDKDNTDERYKHDIELLSEREVLNHVYFIDAVQGDSTVDVYKSNSTKVIFFGDVNEFVGRLNACLSYQKLDYTAVVDEGVTSDDKQVSFEDKYILEALQEIFNVYEIPYYFVGKTIHVGFTENTITYPLKYGFDEALLSISKQNANYALINKIKGQGSSDNIPYYYPNESDDRAAIEAAGKKWITPIPNLMPSIYRETEGAEMFYEAKNNTYPDGEGGYYEFENEYSDRNQKQGTTTFEEIKPTIKEMTNASGQRIDMFTEFAYDLNDSDETDEDGNYLHPYFFAKLRKFDGEFGFNLFDHAIESQTMQFSFTSGVCGACSFELGVGVETNKNIVQVDDDGNLKRDKDGNVLWENQTPQDRQNDTQNYEVWIALKKDDSTYGQIMPNKTQNLRPSTDDTFVILGIDLPLSYVKAAEKKLEDSLIKYMWMNNKEKFTFSIKFSRIFFTEHPEVLEQLNENARVLIEYNGQQHTLYVDSFTYKTDESSPLPEIEVNLVDTLTIGQNSLQNALDSVKQDILSSIGGGDFLKQGLKYFIRKDISDWAKGDKTFYGLIRNLAGAIFGNYIKGESGSSIDNEGAAEFSTLFLRGALIIGNYIEKKQGGKITEQGVADLMSAIVRDKVESSDFLPGVLGQGFTLKKKSDGKSYLEVDELFVRIKALFTELEIKKLSYAGGNFIFSPAGIVLSNVEETESGYKCYFINNDGTTATENLFKVDDLCLCQTFNIKDGVHQNVTNKRYWRACIEVGENYFTLSKTDCELNSSIPEDGDSVVVLGNKTDTERQNAIIISVYGEGSPSITQHNGINTYSLVGTEKTRISPTLNTFTGEFHFTSGENVQDITTGLNQKVNDAVKTLAEQAGFITAIQDDLEAVKNQADGAIESWFYDPAPTLDNEPAVNWTDDATNKVHLGDLYYDGEGKSYRFQIVDGQYTWKVLTDSDIAKALSAAQSAQDTADGKRRVFVVQPTSESVYDVGDLWVNATYSNTYSNDLLRCKTAKAKGTLFSIDHWEKASKYTDDTTANKAIADAANAQQAANNADQKAQEAANRLNNWAADGTISPTEKPALKDEIARIDSDKEQITAGYTKYGLGTPSTYTSVYSTYRTQLVALTASSPENITIPSDFRTNQTAYYTQRSASLNSIASAAKNLADSINTDLQGYKTTVESKFSATNDKITAAVTETKTYTDTSIGELQVGGRNYIYMSKTFNYNYGNLNCSTSREETQDISVPSGCIVSFKIDYVKESTSVKGIYFNVTRTFNVGDKCAWRIYIKCSSKRLVTYFGHERGRLINITINNEWKEITNIYQITEGTTNTFTIYSSEFQVGDIIYIHSAKLEEGSKPTDWSPAPEDVTEQIVSETKSQVEIAKGEITAEVTSTVDNKINAIQIGGRNYVLQSGNWTVNGKPSSWITVNTQPSITLNGKNLIIKKTVSSKSGVSAPLSKKLVSGEKYTFIYKLNATLTNGYVEFQIAPIFNGNHLISIDSNGEKEGYIVFTAQNFDNQHIWINFNYAGQNSQIELEYIGVYAGILKQDWTPAPEDTEESISELSSRVTINEQGISQSATKTELATVKNEMNGSINSLTQRVSQAEINMQPDNIWIGISSKVDSVVNDIQIGGRNLLTGTKDFSGWTNTTSAQVDYTMIYQGLIPFKTTAQWAYLYQKYNYEKGKTYTISAWVRTNVANKITVGCYSWLNSVAGLGDQSITIKEANKWIRYTFTFTAIADNEQFTRLESSNPTATNPLWVCGMKLEEGNKATSWSPAPEDYSTTEEIKTGITISQNSINVFGKSISLTGAVTFTSLAYDAQEKINTAQSTATSASTAASNAQSTANTAKSTADSALSKATTAQTTAETARTEKIELARLGTTIIDGGYLKTSLIDANELFSQNITVSNNATITNLKAVNADVSGILTSTSGKIGSFKISTDGFESNDEGTTSWLGSGNKSLITSNKIRVQNHYKYGSSNVSMNGVYLGDNTDIFNDYGYNNSCVAYFYRQGVGLTNNLRFKPAVIIESDNSGTGNTSLELRGTLLIKSGGIIGGGYLFNAVGESGNVLDFYKGTSFAIYNTVSDYKYFYLPGYRTILDYMGYSTSAGKHIVFPIEILSLPGSKISRIACGTTSGYSDRGQIFGVNGNNIGTYFDLYQGDSLRLMVYFDGGTYMFCILNHSN